jgi:hypothetical protein
MTRNHQVHVWFLAGAHRAWTRHGLYLYFAIVEVELRRGEISHLTGQLHKKMKNFETDFSFLAG